MDRRLSVLGRAALVLAMAAAGGMFATGQAHGAAATPVDARSYGVTCDGTHDDTAAIQAAFSSGFAIQLPAGTCNTTATINIKSLVNNGQIVRGAGQGDPGGVTTTGRTIIKPSSAANPVFALDGSALSTHYVIGFQLADLTIDMSNLADSSSSVGISLTQGFDLKFDHIRSFSPGKYVQRTFQINEGVYTSEISNSQGSMLKVQGSVSFGGNPTTLELTNTNWYFADVSSAANIHFSNGAIQPQYDAGSPPPISYVASGNTNLLGFYPTVAAFNAVFGGSGGIYMATAASFDNMQYLLTSSLDFEQGGPIPAACSISGSSWAYGSYTDGVHGCHPMVWVVSVGSGVRGCDLDGPTLAGLYLLSQPINGCTVRSFRTSGNVAEDVIGKQTVFTATMNLAYGQAFHCYSDLGMTAATCLLDASNGQFNYSGGTVTPQADSTNFLNFANAGGSVFAGVNSQASVAGSSFFTTNGAKFYCYGASPGYAQTCAVDGATGAATFAGQLRGATGVYQPAADGQMFVLNNAAGSNFFVCTSNATPASSICGIDRGAQLILYSDNGSTPTISLNGANGNLTATGQISAATVKTTTTTVAGLPSAATAGAGARAYVTDATACTFAGTPTGGGSTKCPVVSDGSAWKEG